MEQVEKVENENLNADVSSEAPAEEKQTPKVNKLFNIVSLAFACVLLVAQVFLIIAMSVGIIAVDGVQFNSADLTHFLKLFEHVGSENDIPKLICLSIMASLWLALLVVVIIGLIKAIIGIFRFFKLGEEYESREVRFGKYVRTVSRSYGMAVATVALSLAFTPSLTGMGIGVVTFGSIIYIASCATVILFKQVLGRDGKLNLAELLVNIGKKLVMFMLACLLVANIKESFNVGLKNIFDEAIFDFDDVMSATTTLYFKVAQPISLIIVYTCVVSVVGEIMMHYALNNAKKDSNITLKKAFITLLVFALLFCIGDCVVYGLGGDAGAGDYMNLITDWLGLIFVSIAGIVLTVTKKQQQEQIRV